MRSAERDRFAAYVDAAWPALKGVAYLVCGDSHEAEDLVQAALVKAVAVWPRIADDPTPYLRRVIVNDHISRWRRHKGAELPFADPPERPDSEGDRETSMALRMALRSLAPRQRAVIVLRYYEDLTEQQTADVLGIAVGTVKSQARDALARLREHGFVGEDQTDAAAR